MRSRFSSAVWIGERGGEGGERKRVVSDEQEGGEEGKEKGREFCDSCQADKRKNDELQAVI